MPHPIFFAAAKREGQIATLCKRDRPPLPLEYDDEYGGDAGGYSYSHEQDLGEKYADEAVSDSLNSYIPHGLCNVHSDEGMQLLRQIQSNQH